MKDRYYYEKEIERCYFEYIEEQFIKVKEDIDYTSIRELVSTLKKEIIIDMCKQLEIKGYSKLTKDKLIDFLVDGICNNKEKILKRLSYKELLFLDDIIKYEKNKFEFDLEKLSVIGSLASLGIVYRIKDKDNKYIVVPNELKSAIKNILQDKEYIEYIREVSEGTYYLDGLMAHYGVISGSDIYKILDEVKPKVLKEGYMEFYCDYIFRSYEVFTDAGYLIHPYAFAPEDIISEIHVRKNINYDFNNIDYFVSLGKDYSFEYREKVTDVSRLLKAKNVDDDRICNIIKKLVYYIKNDMGAMSLVEMLQNNNIEIGESEDELVNAIAGVINNTPMWILKGLTSIELDRMRKTTIVKEKTPGRNEPCPCGSGKKYKKCCGKN
ncbi:SEC-C domain-containing protein [Clostridium sp. MSJ-8]|uniref:YecA family protein n=1 Tax=Clostridium sp. MSJ-8 TaxID=2841510 RepID=UPI001C0F19BD|nr:SEC-C metal-binding domain-containing protein [Clostridium sp. MSJ-8]MBU5488954.1 SEC-C domain-containing protein [Clostridium sp. MSJ-8]